MALTGTLGSVRRRLRASDGHNLGDRRSGGEAGVEGVPTRACRARFASATPAKLASTGHVST